MDIKKAFEEVQKVGLIVDVVPRVVEDRFVYILGERFDAEDLEETLTEVRSSPSGTYMNDKRMVDAMKAIGIIDGSSPSWGTHLVEKGGDKRLDQLIQMLREALKASGSDNV